MKTEDWNAEPVDLDAFRRSQQNQRRASEIALARRIIARTRDFRLERVHELREVVNAGGYELRPEEIAERMLLESLSICAALETWEARP